MIHKMRLQPTYFNYILNGTKRIEVRLNDEKRQKIQTGDIIEFSNTEDENLHFKTKVIDILHYTCFKELMDALDISLLADKSIIKNDLLNVLNTFYSDEEQNKYGVLGIKIGLI